MQMFEVTFLTIGGGDGFSRTVKVVHRKMEDLQPVAVLYRQVCACCSELVAPSCVPACMPARPRWRPLCSPFSARSVGAARVNLHVCVTCGARQQHGVIMDFAIERGEDGGRLVTHPMNGLFAERLQKLLEEGHKLVLLHLYTDASTDGAFRTHNMVIRLGNQDAASYHKASSYVKILSVPDLKIMPNESPEQ